MSKLLEIKDLAIEFNSERGPVRAVDGLSLQLDKNGTLGIVGESGSGKSVTALSIMRLLPSPPAQILRGSILFDPSGAGNPVDILKLPNPAIQAIRGKEISMIFQEPMSSLNPVFPCGHQVTEAIQLHQKVSFETAKDLTIKLFERVQLANPTRIFKAFPHQISGGQKQRVMIAMAMSCNPAILIADEPTTALDVTVQKAILDLMRDLKEEAGLSMIFISHDLGVIAEVCDRVAVMHQGKIVEEGAVQQILQSPEHPYTRGLVACRPSLHRKLLRLPTVPDFLENRQFEAKVITEAETASRNTALYAQEPLLSVKNLKVRFPAKKNWFGKTSEWLYAVDDVSFDLYAGETFGLAGESGCGKTTLGRAIARLTEAYSGSIFYKGADLLQLDEDAFRQFRREIQVVFQDPYSSLNPRMTIGEAIMEPMQVHQLYGNHKSRKENTIELLETVGLQADYFQRYPHEFSGGQRQRICVARALSLEPRFLVCDEMVSSLDVSIQATILNLLMDLQEKFGLSYLFISHDLSVIKQMCDRLMVMHAGKQDAIGLAADIYQKPPTVYVKGLLDAIPRWV